MKTFENRKSLFRTTLVAAALAAGLGANGTVIADTGDAAEPLPRSDSVGAAISDAAITAEVEARYRGEDRLKSAQISVTTTNGVVTLTGSVGNSEAKSVAVELAKGVEGVKGVEGDELSIPSAAVTGPPTAHQLARTTEEAISDSMITAKVKSELLADSVGKGLDVSVNTQHGVVTLQGKLANPDAVDHIKGIVQKVAGVTSVDASGLSSTGG